ncbi:hypothetical protein DFP73DRAFT_256324 [Morchella snyderi]|nr:hypothetical protein DFP73DRAFT_256324 [Morchella snyderi]
MMESRCGLASPARVAKSSSIRSNTPPPPTPAPVAETGTKKPLTLATAHQSEHSPRDLTSKAQETKQPDHTPPASTPGSDHTPPTMAKISIFGLYERHYQVAKTKEACDKWNENNREQYTLAGCAWFKHSDTQAFFFLDGNRVGREIFGDKYKRTGIITVTEAQNNMLDRYSGYEGFIYGGEGKGWKKGQIADLSGGNELEIVYGCVF